MGLTARQVGELVTELAPLLCGAEVRAVQPQPPRDLLLVFVPRDPASSSVLRLCLSVDPEAARLHLQRAPVRRHQGSSDPFFARLETALVGCVLYTLEQVQDDRVVRMTFRRDGHPWAQVMVELTGRHANLVRLDGAGHVLDCLVPPAATSAAAARLASGAAYARPPGRAPSDPGPTIRASFPDADEGETPARIAPLSARVERALGASAEARHDEEQRRALLRRLERRLAGARAQLAGLEQRARACEEAERLRMDGELLLAHLASIPRGASSVELPDAFAPDSPPRSIALDAGLSARRNAEKFFARYKKLQRTRQRLPEELGLARAACEAAEDWLRRAAEEAPAALEAEAVLAGVLTAPKARPERAAQPEPRQPYLTFRALRGSQIRVGRSARDNDRLTFREARGNDLWLHTADSPGSHVVLRLERGAEPDAEELLDAAHLAAHFSPLRGSPRVDIHVARQKQVHKPRKAPAGLVTLSGGKLLRLRVESERLARLLETRTRPAPESGAGQAHPDPSTQKRSPSGGAG